MFWCCCFHIWCSCWSFSYFLFGTPLTVSFYSHLQINLFVSSLTQQTPLPGSFSPGFVSPVLTTQKKSDNKHRKKCLPFKHLFIPQSWNNEVCHQPSNLNLCVQAGKQYKFSSRLFQLQLRSTPVESDGK